MKTSIIIPLYNKETTIGRAIESVLAQSYEDFEVIVIDDGSTDGSVERVASYLSNNVQLHTQLNAGPGAARNRGAAYATGELLAFLDADDEWRPAFLRSAVDALQRWPDALAYICGYDALAYRGARSNKAAQFATSTPKMPSLDDSGANLKVRCDAMHSSACVVRRTAFQAAGGYYERDRCLYGEDSFLWLCILLSGPVLWDAHEHVVFHVEDSDIGFAQTNRMIARPLSTFGHELEGRIIPEYAPALKRVTQTYAEMDINTLWASRAYCAALRLSKRYPDLERKYSLPARLRRKISGLFLRSSDRSG